MFTAVITWGSWSTTRPFWNTTPPPRAHVPPSGIWYVLVLMSPSTFNLLICFVWFFLFRLTNWDAYFASTVYQENQESGQKGLGVGDGGEVCALLLLRDHHHWLWHALQDTGWTSSIVAHFRNAVYAFCVITCEVWGVFPSIDSS